jgi:anaerobic selenocysteine-containing dehydrogenase
LERVCDLCEADRHTTWYHEDDLCWVAECEICGVPMVVWKRHAIDPPADELASMLEHLARAADEVLGQGNWSVDTHMRQIPDHFHAHARDPNWWFRRFGGGSRPQPDSSGDTPGGGTTR